MPEVLLRSKGKFLEAKLVEEDRESKQDTHNIIQKDGTDPIDPKTLGHYGSVEVWFNAAVNEFNKTFFEELLGVASSYGADYVLVPNSAQCVIGTHEIKGKMIRQHHMIVNLYIK